MKIFSVNKTAWLEVIKDNGAEYFIVELKDEGLAAKAKVYAYMSDSMPDLFRFMKDNWKGWDGEKGWGSLEGELNFVATTDKLGHIELKIFLCPDLQNGWEVRTTIYLEPNQLDSIYEEVKSLFPLSEQP